MKIPALSYCLSALLLLSSSIVLPQSMNDLGMMGGSGVAFTPTIAVTPASHFRLDVTRMSLLRSGGGGLYSAGITGGLSSNMEFTLKFQSSESESGFSSSFTGFGGKFLLPVELPFKSRAAVWGEVVLTGNEYTESLLPSRIDRGALVLQAPAFRNFNTNILIGLTSVDYVRRLLVGCNASRVINGSLKIGGEVQYNYFSQNDLQESMLLLLRVHQNVCIQVSPGYLRSANSSSWMFSIGISASTSNIDFVAFDQEKKKASGVPSFDELEKQIHEEKKKE